MIGLPDQILGEIRSDSGKNPIGIRAQVRSDSGKKFDRNPGSSRLQYAKPNKYNDTTDTDEDR